MVFMDYVLIAAFVMIPYFLCTAVSKYFAGRQEEEGVFIDPR